MSTIRALILSAGIVVATAAGVHAAPMWVTGYDQLGITADGTPADPGVAACPPTWASGTVIEVSGVGIVTCHDHYARWLSPPRIDVWVPTVAAAYALTGLHNVELVPPWWYWP